MTNQFETSQQMQGGQVPPSMNHGGHELFDVKEVLGATLAALSQSMILRPHVQDPELLDILDRQYRFALDEYNITVECFKSGKDPSHPTQRYQMKAGSDFIYGIKEKAPSKPIQSIDEISDEIISGFLLGATKEGATGKTAASLEVCNPVVRRVLADSVANCIEMAYELAIYQNKHQYYQVPQLNERDMNLLLNTFAPAQGQPGMPKNLQ